MQSSVVSRLSVARQRQFVGRTMELSLLQSALAESELPFNVLYLFGPGGVGKTALLGEFARMCEQMQLRTYRINARSIEPTPDAFFNALRSAMQLSSDASPLQCLAETPSPHVILIDTYETLAPLDSWMREVFLPQLPQNVLLVLAGRNPPSAEWRSDAAWQTLIRPWALRNLSPSESREFLSRRAVPSAEHQSVLDFTHGHPLALSLVADVFDQRPGVRFQPEDAPDVVKILLEKFVQKVPGPAHRAALEVCALVRVTSEGLLSEALAMPDVHELFEWLRGLSFIEAGQGGLFPHDLAREALVADLRWRNPDWYAELHNRTRQYYFKRVQQSSSPQAQQRLLFDYIFLHRDNPVVRPFFEWQTGSSLLAEAMRDEDVPVLLAMVEQHEGKESAHLAAHWFESQPQGVVIVRDSEGKAAGFLAMVTLSAQTTNSVTADPAVRNTWRYLQQHAPLRASEVATLFRYWLARDTYQSVSAVQSLLFVLAVRHYLTTPNLAFTFFPCADADFWLSILTYADITRLPEADFEVGGRRYGVFGHDWRAVPPLTWLTIMGERELAGAPPTPSATPQQLLVLSESEFKDALHDALRNYLRPTALGANPLVRSRLIMERVGAHASLNERIATLQGVLREAAESLHKAPRDAKLYRAVQQTYFVSAHTQEEVAQQLDLPFSTYCRHLKAGEMRVVDMLWHKEIGDLERA